VGGYSKRQELVNRGKETKDSVRKVGSGLNLGKLVRKEKQKKKQKDKQKEKEQDEKQTQKCQKDETEVEQTEVEPEKKSECCESDQSYQTEQLEEEFEEFEEKKCTNSSHSTAGRAQKTMSQITVWMNAFFNDGSLNQNIFVTWNPIQKPRDECKG
jgi:hypothetical protein